MRGRKSGSQIRFGVGAIYAGVAAEVQREVAGVHGMAV